MINMSQPIDTSTSTTTSNHLSIDLQPIQTGRSCRTFNFDTSSSSSYFESNLSVEEQFFECCLPCQLWLPSPSPATSNSNNNTNTNDIIFDTRTCTSDTDNHRNLSFTSTNNIQLKRQSCILSTDSGESAGTITLLRPQPLSTSATYEYQSSEAVTDKSVVQLESWDPGYEKLYQKQWMKKTNNKYILHTDLSFHSFASVQTALKVLIVDDSVAMTKVLKRWLEAEGCQVTVAENGSIGLTHLQSQSFDITLMDFIMVSCYLIPSFIDRLSLCPHSFIFLILLLIAGYFHIQAI